MDICLVSLALSVLNYCLSAVSMFVYVLTLYAVVSNINTVCVMMIPKGRLSKQHYMYRAYVGIGPWHCGGILYRRHVAFTLGAKPAENRCRHANE